MISKEEVLSQLTGLFSTQKFAVLSTNQQGQPYSNLVAFVSDRDLKTHYFATTRATRKFANISSDSRVSLLMDSRSNRSTDFADAVAVTAVGRTEEVTRDERDPVLDKYLAKHPELKDFVLSPTCALMKVTVDTYFIVNRFQNVQELHMKT